MFPRKINSFVQRAGRVSKRQQQGLDVFLKDYALQISDRPWCFEDIFQRESPTIIEIGFGMGRSLLTMAKQNTGLNYIGIEVHQAGIGGLAADLHDEALKNVRIVADDAVRAFEHCILDNSLAGVQIFFPDPWHKKRHHKRRLIQPEFVKRVAQKLIKGGFIHCATDWQDYADQMLDVLSSEPLLKNQSDLGGFSDKPESRPITKFERRGERLGHGVWDVVFVKK